jgi:D-alanine-D-alanine ligase
MIFVDPDWWKTLFDDIYLITDAEIVCNPTLTRREIDIVVQSLCLQPTDRIVDLCGGQGRHAMELASRGYRRVTVVDYSPFLLRCATHTAATTGLSVAFCQGDVRWTPIRTGSVDVVLLMANSFGYFIDPADDQRLLNEIARILAPGGRFLLDLTDYDYTLRHFLPESWHETAEDIVVCWKRELRTDVICVREMVLSKTKGLLRDRTYAERLYHPERLVTLLQTAGFAPPTITPNAFVFESDDATDYGLATHRMLVTTTKA